MRLKCHPLQSPVSENGTQRGQLTRGGQTAPAGKNFFFFARAKDVLVQGEFQTAFSFPAFLLQHNTALLSFHFKSWVENICAGACGLLCSCPKPSWGSLGDVKASCLSAGFIPCRVYSLHLPPFHPHHPFGHPHPHHAHQEQIGLPALPQLWEMPWVKLRTQHLQLCGFNRFRVDKREG